jgi:UDP-N-acetyl-2-amino-2-deoxyglucuronate dehydrogenase
LIQSRGVEELLMSHGPSEKIKFALIGCGTIAEKHVTAIRKLDHAELTGVFDIDKGVAQAFGEKHRISWFTDEEKLIKKATPDILNILTPSGAHGETVFRFMGFNRHFVVEKPLALRLDQIDAIIEECDRRGLKIFVVQQNRFNPPIQKLREALSKGRFGKLVLGTVRVRWKRDQAYYDHKSWRGTWAYDGGVLTNQASHHVDMLIWLMGDVESVIAKTTTRLVNIEAEDTGVAILKFKNGALGVIEATTCARPKDIEGSISVLGEKGSVEIGGFFMNELKLWNFSEPDDMDKGVFEKFGSVPDVPAWNHTEFFRDVVKSLHGGGRGLIDGIEGRRSVELINAIYESAETGREVFLRFTPKMCRLGMRSEPR